MEGRALAFVEDMVSRLELSNSSGQLPQEERNAVERVSGCMKALADLWADIQVRDMDAATRYYLSESITALSHLVDSVTQLREARQGRFEREVRTRLDRLEARPTDEPVLGVF